MWWLVIDGFWRYKEQDLNAQLYIHSYILVIAMSKWPKYKLHDKETKSDSNLTTWITRGERWIEDL